MGRFVKVLATLLIALFSPLGAYSADVSLSISELYYSRPAGTDYDTTFFIRNNGSSPVEVSFWELTPGMLYSLSREASPIIIQPQDSVSCTFYATSEALCYPPVGMQTTISADLYAEDQYVLTFYAYETITLNQPPCNPQIYLTPSSDTLYAEDSIWIDIMADCTHGSWWNCPLNYDIFYSIDNGINWDTICTNQIATGGVLWVIPNIYTKNCLIRIEGTDWYEADFADTIGPYHIRPISTTIYVPADRPTIQAGIDAARTGDTILVAPGIYIENINFLGKEIKVYSSYGAEATIIQGNQLDLETVSFTNNEPKGTEIKGFTITGGKRSGIYCIGSSPNIINNVITNNFGRNDNSNDGGGITLENTSNSLIANNLIYENHSGYGPAIHVGDNDAFSQNDTIMKNIIYGNTGAGDIRCLKHAAGLQIINNTIWPTTHSGILNQGCQINIINNIIFNAHSSYAVYNDWGSIVADYNCTFNNSIGNYFNLIPGGNNIYGNAYLVDTLNQDFHLLSESPCINTGDPNPIYNDPDGSRNDMGAIPFSMPAYPPELATIGPKNVIEGDTLRFRVSATDSNQTIPELGISLKPPEATLIDSGNGAGSFVWPIPYGAVGEYQVLFIATDGVLEDSEMVTISVTPAPPSIAGLLIDNFYPVMNLINHMPLISWDFSDPGNDNPQTTFEIAVGTDNDWVTAELWNPAPFNSADTFVTYNGVPLTDGQTCYLRIRVFNGVLWSEWFMGVFRLNTVPTIPAMLYPLDSIVVNTLRPALGIAKSSDPEDANLFYDFEVISISGHIMASEYEMPGSGETIQWQVPVDLSEDQPYRWHVRVTDLSEYSEWSEYQPFWINATEEPPFAFNLMKLPDTLRNMVFDMLPDFNWTESLDPDPRDPVHYTFYLSLDSNFLFTLTKDNLTLNSYATVDSLAFATKYWWKVKAADSKGNFTNSTNVLSFRTWKLGDANGDWGINLLDVSFIINSLYRGGTKPNPKYVGDFNGDCKMNLLDVSYLINSLYHSGPAPKIGCE
jgi:hypothetical protein